MMAGSALRLACLWLVAVSLSGGVAEAAVGDVRSCLRRADLACAERAHGKLQDAGADTKDALHAEALLAFHQGRYDDAVTALDALAARGIVLEAETQGTPFRGTAAAAAGFEEVVGDGVRVRHAPGVDTILADEAVEALEGSREAYDRLFGGGPDHDVVLDLYPTASRFISASGLPPESVQTTGVVALSKWTRLLLTSPRALSRGYGWKDTVAHEYIHLVVSYRTGDRAPVWLQEGLAKQLEGYWRGDRDGILPAHHQSLLAGALASGEFVPFEKFKHSMAYLDSGEEAALAFGQVSTMIRYLIETSGDEVLPGLMRRVREGEDPQQVVAELAGHTSWEDFRQGWLAWLRTLPLIEEQLSTLPVVLDGDGDEFDSDPLLAQNAKLRRLARIGDLLREAGHHRAALVEYGKAIDPEGPPSPMLLARRAACHEALGELDAALLLTDEGVRLYPEFTLLQVTRGRLLDAMGRGPEALVAWKAAHDLNPYDPAVQRALVEGYGAVGQPELARRHLRYARILATGGAITDG